MSCDWKTATGGSDIREIRDRRKIAGVGTGFSWQNPLREPPGGLTGAPRQVGAMSDGTARKPFYKIGEVCQITDTQPYVLRFWESEFPQLAPKKSRNGQRIYRRKDVDLVLQIKRLLYEEGYTIAGARKKLGMGDGQGALDDLFEPAAIGEPDRLPDPPRPIGPVLSSLSGRLHDILRVMDSTDKRLKGKR